MTDTTLDPSHSASEPAPSYRSVMQKQPVRIVALSRFLSRMGGQIMTYGIMVFLAAEGASQLEISFSKSAAFVAALLFGLQGGMLADSRPKRQILLFGFLLLGAVCILIPLLLGTSNLDLLLIIFVASAINQVVAPGLKSIVAIVSTPAELASTSSLVNIVGSIGSSIGSTLIAPVLIKRFDIDAVLIAAGLLYLLSAVRIYRLPAAETLGKVEATKSLRSLDWKPRALSLRYNANWIMANRPVASMMLVAVLSAALLQGVTALIPLFVRDVLNADPTNSVYIFVLSGVGFFVGAAISPKVIHRFGERKVAFWSLVLMAVSIMALAVIEFVSTPLAFISPLRLLNHLDSVDLSKTMLAAGVVAFPANLGSTMCLQAVQVYINRTVPEDQQGGIFGLQQVQENALNLIVILLLGAISSITGPQYIFFFAPVVVGIVGVALIAYSYQHTTGVRPNMHQTLGFLVKDVPPEPIHDIGTTHPSSKDEIRDAPNGSTVEGVGEVTRG